MMQTPGYFGQNQGVPGVQEAATLYKLDSGWLVSHMPKAEPPKPAPAFDARGRAKAELKQQVEVMALVHKAVSAEEYEEVDLDEAVSKIVPHQAPGPFGLADFVSVKPIARAFPTLREALDYLAAALA